MHSNTIHLAIADDQTMVREGLCSLITFFGQFQVDIQANDGVELIDKLQRMATPPDICIVDLNMPHKNGWETLKEIKSRWPSIKVLILTTHQGRHIVDNILKNKADGYIPKSSTAENLQKSLIELYERGYYFHESVSNQIYEILKKYNKYLPNKKEIEFLSHCCNEDSYKEIAKKMNVSPRTVEGYRDSLFAKLNINSRIGLVLYALRNGIAKL